MAPHPRVQVLLDRHAARYGRDHARDLAARLGLDWKPTPPVERDNADLDAFFDEPAAVLVSPAPWSRPDNPDLEALFA